MAFEPGDHRQPSPDDPGCRAYTLHISLGDPDVVAVAAPGSLILLGTAVLGVIRLGRRLA
jgi:hypothetical protein